MTKKIGYGSPPDYTKWQKGQSGNPSGSRKGQLNMATILDRELSTIISITEGGKQKKITKREGVVKALVNGALKGDHRAVTSLIRIISTLGEPKGVQDAAITADDEAILADFLARNTPDGGA